MISYFAAITFAAATSLPLVMQFGLTFGAPWGQFANGGKFPGKLPPLWRGLAVVQGGLLVGMAWAMLAKGGVVATDIHPALFYAALALSVLTFIANAISPSLPERRLWAPVTAVMAASALCIALFPNGAHL